MFLKSHVAIHKSHRCDECGRKIPIGARYFCLEDGSRREHTNCLDYEKQPMLPEGYNQNRSIAKAGAA